MILGVYRIVPPLAQTRTTYLKFGTIFYLQGLLPEIQARLQIQREAVGVNGDHRALPYTHPHSHGSQGDTTAIASNGVQTSNAYVINVAQGTIVKTSFKLNIHITSFSHYWKPNRGSIQAFCLNYKLIEKSA